MYALRILLVHEIDWFKKVIFEPHHLAELFSIKGHQVFVIDCGNPDIKNLTNALYTRTISRHSMVYDEASITIIRPPSFLVKGLNRLTHFLTCENIIRKTVIDNSIDIILLYGVATNGIQTIKVAKQMKIPVVFRVLDIAHGLIKIPLLTHLVKKYEKSVICNATKILATTPNLTRYAIEMGAKKDRVETFPLGINARDFKPLKKDFEFAKNLGIDEQDTVIVFIGTIYDFAGLDKIISKYKILKSKVTNIKLLIVGGGPSFKQLKALVREKKLESDIILTGFKPQQELPRYISLADICVNPFEINYVTNRILPTKILEYFACAKPVLSTPLKGTKELLPNEDFGIIYSTSEKFVETLANLIQDKKKLNELGKRGYAYVKENHNWDVLSKKLIDEFEKVIKENS